MEVKININNVAKINHCQNCGAYMYDSEIATLHPTIEVKTELENGLCHETIISFELQLRFTASIEDIKNGKKDLEIKMSKDSNKLRCYTDLIDVNGKNTTLDDLILDAEAYAKLYFRKLAEGCNIIERHYDAYTFKYIVPKDYVLKENETLVD